MFSEKALLSRPLDVAGYNDTDFRVKRAGVVVTTHEQVVRKLQT